MSEKPTTKIVVTVVGGLILAGLLWVFKTYLKVAAIWVWGVIVACWDWLFATHQVQGWLVVIMAIALGIVLVQAIKRLWKSRKIPTSVYELFREGIFEGFYWRWRYDSRNSVIRLRVFCPDRTCDLELHRKTAYVGLHHPNNTELSCGRCGYSKFIKTPPENLEFIIVREIQRLIRTDQWKTHPK